MKRSEGRGDVCLKGSDGGRDESFGGVREEVTCVCRGGRKEVTFLKGSDGRGDFCL